MQVNLADPQEDAQNKSAGGSTSRPLIIIQRWMRMSTNQRVHSARCKSIGITMIATIAKLRITMPSVDPGVETGSGVVVGVGAGVAVAGRAAAAINGRGVPR